MMHRQLRFVKKPCKKIYVMYLSKVFARVHLVESDGDRT